MYVPRPIVATHNFITFEVLQLDSEDNMSKDKLILTVQKDNLVFYDNNHNLIIPEVDVKKTCEKVAKAIWES